MPPAQSASVRRINSLAKRLESASYLEIGVRRGNTILNVNISHRVGVDPVFLFDFKATARAGLEFHQLKSDDYFAQLTKTTVFDIFFLDGLHTFEQTARDFLNSLKHSHPRSVWLIDDTRPRDVYSALPDMQRAIKYRELEAKSTNRSWHGDVFKTVFLIHDFMQGLNYRTIVDAGNPQTLVWQSDDADRQRVPRFNSFEAISRLDYFDLLDNIDILRECTERNALDLCGREVGSAENFQWDKRIG